MTTHDPSPLPDAGADVPVVAPMGDLDFENIEPLANRLRAAARTSPAVVLDAKDITFGDSSFLRVLISVHQITDLRIARPRPAMLRLLELTGMDHVLHVHDSVEGARSAPLSAADSA
ncbi:STAS domain-containing protein [Actinacidiphila acidipaludis]|uniref:STAS domain-containing protein n=1 Tax=Actinacidiphila acidipaludis TaxID=2873382 RepID=A0ABS7QIR8_9ACTN|nr:STAS domain-containing protein [Streptomyces acidipaludis]MBY8883074.1 STAS domain-containing protein [Streptomyces acidipaludis]